MLLLEISVSARRNRPSDKDLRQALPRHRRRWAAVLDGPNRGRVGKSVYGKIWQQARKAAFTATPTRRCSCRPTSTRWKSPRLGPTVKVLFAVYAHRIVTDEDAVNPKIEAAFDATAPRIPRQPPRHRSYVPAWPRLCLD
ncbi:hypothetical protein GCM10009555_100210 [Acrocarpospora macrocephala]|uniref:Uncharacterized protein n=1 Tax=Acrocarpospora macrocephala TaxID=150177 RepID=A0A5M3XAP0_9ACTN|nr:hypothetical protein Amac_101690 [Acrocarpospora macrocephala]